MSSVTVPGSSAAEENRRRPITSRLAGLAEAIEGTRRTSMNVRQVMLAAGATCMGLGIVAIVLGWYGAAHSSYLFQEVPYLISGGLLGVALVAGGGFLFFASWFVRIIEENHRHASRLERTLDRVDRVLGAVVEGTDFWERASTPSTSDFEESRSDARHTEAPMGSYREEDGR